MKPLLLSLFLTLQFIGSSHAQSEKLLGKWVLDIVLSEDNALLPINDIQFSTEAIYVISPHKIEIHGYEQPARFIGSSEIQLGTRTLKYGFSEDYLILIESGSNKKLCLLKHTDFIKKYPEFKEKRVPNFSTEVYEMNKLSDVSFQHPEVKELQSYVIANSPLLKKKTSGNFQFTIDFLLSPENFISDILIEGINDKKMEAEVRKAVFAANQFYRNNTGKTLLVSTPFQFFKMYKSFDEPTKKVYDHYLSGDDWYAQNEFEKAIQEYEKGLNIEFDKKRFTGLFYEDYIIHLGVSYLATNQLEKADKTFRILGDETNFKIRNYLRYFSPKAK